MSKDPARDQTPQERGPWRAATTDSGVWLFSEDFTHDVSLHVKGDFASDAQKFAYAEMLAERLNRETWE